MVRNQIPQPSRCAHLVSVVDTFKEDDLDLPIGDPLNVCYSPAVA
jgi:hypothetical protein